MAGHTSPGGQRCRQDSEQPGLSTGGVSSPVKPPDGHQDSSRSEGELSSEDEDIGGFQNGD